MRWFNPAKHFPNEKETVLICIRSADNKAEYKTAYYTHKEYWVNNGCYSSVNPKHLLAWSRIKEYKI